MIALNRRTMTYTYGKNYLVDIVTTKNEYEAWLYEKDRGMKYFMFGMPTEQQSYFEFMEITRDNVEDYIGLVNDYNDWMERMD